MHKSNLNSVTLVFCIKNIYNLFIYKDHWTDAKIMRLVIKEIMATSQFTWHYVGENYKPILNDLALKSSHSALITITILDFELRDIPKSHVVSIFIKELSNQRNRYLFENSMLDESRNLTSINIIIKPSKLRRQLLANYVAA